MLRTLIIASTIAISASAIAPQAAAGPQAEALITETADRVSGSQFDPEALRPAVDTSAIAKFTLGRHGRGISKDDLARFTEAFDAYLFDLIDSQAHRFEGADIQVTGDVDRTPRDSIVTTRVTLPNGEIDTVRWRVIDRGAAWKVVDVEVEGIWLAIEQRAQFAAILDRPGADVNDLINEMRG